MSLLAAAARPAMSAEPLFVPMATAVATAIQALVSRLPARKPGSEPASTSASAVGDAVLDDDHALVARAARGDRNAFDQLHRRHVDGVWRRLTHLVGPDPDREDLTQQIFFEVFRGLSGFRGEASFRTYLHRVAVHMACDHLRRRRRQPSPISAEMIEVLSAPDASPEATAAERQRLALIWSLLDRIKPKKRIAFILRVADGLSLEEVGRLVGASVPTVAKRVKHAQDELQRLLAHHAQHGGGATRSRGGDA